MLRKYIGRLKRWLKCRHKWEVWDMDNALNPLSCGQIKSVEKMDPNREKIKICLKCTEVRTFGKKTNILW